jgi:hypothetical protein
LDERSGQFTADKYGAHIEMQTWARLYFLTKPHCFAVTPVSQHPVDMQSLKALLHTPWHRQPVSPQ